MIAMVEAGVHGITTLLREMMLSIDQSSEINEHLTESQITAINKWQ